MKESNIMPSNTEINLSRLERTSIPWDFVCEHNGEWDHQAWLDFCAYIERKGYTPVDLNQVGMILERKKAEYWAGKSKT